MCIQAFKPKRFVRKFGFFFLFALVLRITDIVDPIYISLYRIFSAYSIINLLSIESHLHFVISEDIVLSKFGGIMQQYFGPKIRTLLLFLR